MSVYSELVNESGFDPMAPGPQMDPWQPWTLQGALEVLGVSVQGVPEPLFVDSIEIPNGQTESVAVVNDGSFVTDENGLAVVVEIAAKESKEQ